MKNEFKVIADLIEKDKKVLDVGCGKGFMLHDFQEFSSAYTVAGIDVSKYAIENAMDSVKKNVKIGDAKEIPFEDNSFDCVYAPFVISVVPDPVKVVQEMHRVCRVGGHVIVLNHFLSENRFLARTERLISPLTVHIGFKADVDLSSFIARSGFRPVSIERVSVPKLWSLLTFQKQ